MSAPPPGVWEMEQLMRTTPPMDATVAAALLREAKEVFDEQGVVFFLRQVPCLGAVRDGAFIPWDDDIDLGSIYGMHGLTKRSAASVALTAYNSQRYLSGALDSRCGPICQGRRESGAVRPCGMLLTGLSPDATMAGDWRQTGTVQGKPRGQQVGEDGDPH